MKKPYLAWVAALALVTLLHLTIYATAQSILRSSANDPQLQLSVDAASRLAGGAPANSLVSSEQIDISRSLAPFLIIYDLNGKVIASEAVLGDQTPELPSGVLNDLKPGSEKRLTWQPRSDVRIAAVIQSTSAGYVLSGRSLKETENRIGTIGLIVGISLLTSLVILLITVGLKYDWLWKSK